MHWSNRAHRISEGRARVGLSRSAKNEARPSRGTSNVSILIRSNLKYARRAWGNLPAYLFNTLAQLTEMHTLSVAAGHLQLLSGHWYITHSGLLHVGFENRCSGIRAELQRRLSDPTANRWVFKATVYKSPHSKGFVGYGDADPSNVSTVVRGAELRVAETRAVNRALRKAYGIGLCSVEELGALPSVRTSSSATPLSANGSPSSNGNGQPRLRDQLCLLIRQYNLDANLVKAYAADFCGAETLKGASRELVESFISHLSNAAKENRDALVCKLNSYAQQAEVQS